MKNILFITADQWRGDCISALSPRTQGSDCTTVSGSAPVQTPHLDGLAEEGVLFTRHYAQAVPCGPSRASLHTGMYLMNHRSGTNGTPLDARHSNWALELRRAGYDPVLFGYTDTSVDPRLYEPDDPILRSYEGLLPGLTPGVVMENDVTPWVEWLRGKGVETPAEGIALYRQKQGTLEWEDGADAPSALTLPAELHDTRFMTDQCMAYLARATQPWCVHLSLLRPHPPWIAPEPYNRLYPPGRLAAPVKCATVADEARQHPWLAHQLERPLFRAPQCEAKLRRLKASYYGLMSEVDDNLGRLFQQLKHTDQWNDTLIVFTSDHGEQMGDHWLLGKCGYFDQSYHIPLIVRDPDARADGTRGEALNCFTENVDIMPTLLDWCGLDIPVQCDGLSVLPLLHSRDAGKSSGETAKEKITDHWRKAVHWEYDFRDPANAVAEDELQIGLHQCSLNVIRDEHYKYVHFSGLPPLLFDLQSDPEEFHNLAQNPDYQSVLLSYTQQLLSWRMEHSEQTLTHLLLTEEGVVERPMRRGKLSQKAEIIQGELR